MALNIEEREILDCLSDHDWQLIECYAHEIGLKSWQAIEVAYSPEKWDGFVAWADKHGHQLDGVIDGVIQNRSKQKSPTSAFKRQFAEFLELSLLDTVTAKDPTLYLKQLQAVFKETSEPVFELPKNLTKSGITEIFIYAVDEDGRFKTRAEHRKAQNRKPTVQER